VLEVTPLDAPELYTLAYASVILAARERWNLQ